MRYRKIGDFYDGLYQDTQNTWEELAQRGGAFDTFVASIIAKCNPDRLLDIGCGKGYLLAASAAGEKFGMDISRKALQGAARHANASLALGVAEELPFLSGSINVIASIGVMTHFIDDIAATKEIHRVLCSGGHYVLGVFVKPSISERILTKMAEFISPRPQPIRLIRWIFGKIRAALKGKDLGTPRGREQQPIERLYRASELERIIRACGFSIIQKVTKRRFPTAPLVGSHFRIYLLETQA